MFSKWAAVLPVIIITTIINVFICSIVSQTILFQLLNLGVNKYLSLSFALISAVFVYGYIIYYNKFRDIIKGK